MRSLILSSDRVPPEFLGKARQLRTALSRVSYGNDQRLKAILDPLRKRWAINHTLRPEAYRGLERAWLATMPSFGRLTIRTYVNPKKHSLKISELRLIAATQNFDRWDDDDAEPSIAVEVCDLTINKVEFRPAFGCPVILSLHAVGRWFQRARSQSTMELFADIAEVVARSPTLLNSGPANFRIATPRGHWRGERCAATLCGTEPDHRVLNCRTFLDRHEAEQEVLVGEVGPLHTMPGSIFMVSAVSRPPLDD